MRLKPIAFLLVLLITQSIQAQQLDIVDEAMVGYQQGAPRQYVRVSVRNSSGRSMPYRMEVALNDYAGQGEFTIDGQIIAAGQTKTWNLPLPYFTSGGYYRPTITVTSPDAAQVARSSFPFSNSEKTFLQIGDMANWASEKEMVDFTAVYQGKKITPAPAGKTPPPSGKAAPSFGGSPPSPRGMTPSTASGPPGENYVSSLDPSSGLLPDNWLCYLPFRAVFIHEPALVRLSQGEKDALMKWVDSGGDLTIYGSESVSSQTLMMGVIRREAENPLKTRVIQRRWKEAGFWSPFYCTERTDPSGNWLAGSMDNGYSFPYDSTERGGRAGGLLLATAFFILAGPINHFYFRRKNQIRKLFITLPAISVGFCLLIVIYFVISQGFARKGGSFAVTLLDESRDTAFTHAAHSFFSGLYPGGGFNFDREAAFFPCRRPSGYSIDGTRSLRVTTGLFSPSFNFHYYTAMPHTTREHLVYDKTNHTVMNGFEKPIEKVVLFDQDTAWVARDLAPGAKQSLSKLGNKNDIRSRLGDQICAGSQSERDFLRRMDAVIAPAVQEPLSYVARLSGETAPMQSGVKMHSPGICNIVAGIMEQK